MQTEADWTVPAAHVHYSKYPRLVSAIAARPRTYNEQNRAINRMHDSGEVFAIWPGPDLDLDMMPEHTARARQEILDCTTRWLETTR